MPRHTSSLSSSHTLSSTLRRKTLSRRLSASHTSTEKGLSCPRYTRYAASHPMRLLLQGKAEAFCGQLLARGAPVFRPFQSVKQSIKQGCARARRIDNPMSFSFFEIAIEIGIVTDCRSTSKRTGVVASHAPRAGPTIFSLPIAIAISVPIFLLSAGQAGLDCGGLPPLFSAAA